MPDVLTTSRVLVGSTNSLLPFSLTPRELGKREELEERVSRIGDLLLKGLSPRPARTKSRTQYSIFPNTRRFNMFKIAARWILIFTVLASLSAPLIFSQEAKDRTLDASQKQAIVDEVSKL